MGTYNPHLHFTQPPGSWTLRSSTHSQEAVPFHQQHIIVTCSRIHMTIVNRIDRQFFSCGYSVVWRHSRLDYCPLSRLLSRSARFS